MVDSIVEVVVVANTAVDTKTTAEAVNTKTTVEAVKEVMAVVEVVAVTAGAGTIIRMRVVIRMMVATTVSMEDSRVMATTSGAVEAAEAMINNAGNEPVVKEAEETGGIKRIEYKSPSCKKIYAIIQSRLYPDSNQ